MPSQNQGHLYEIPAEMREFAEKSVDQARKALDGFMSAAHRAVEAFGGDANPMQASATDLGRKTLSYAEQNISAALDHAKKMVKAKDPMEALRLQGEFVQSQLQSFQAQMQEFNSAAQKAAAPVRGSKKA